MNHVFVGDVHCSASNGDCLLYVEHEDGMYYPGTTLESMEIHGTAIEEKVVTLDYWDDELALVMVRNPFAPVVLPPNPDNWLWRRFELGEPVLRYTAYSNADHYLPKDACPSLAEIVAVCKRYVEQCQ